VQAAAAAAKETLETLGTLGKKVKDTIGATTGTAAPGGAKAPGAGLSGEGANEGADKASAGTDDSKTSAPVLDRISSTLGAAGQGLLRSSSSIRYGGFKTKAERVKIQERRASAFYEDEVRRKSKVVEEDPKYARHTEAGRPSGALSLWRVRVRLE